VLASALLLCCCACCAAGNGRSQKPCLFDTSTWWTVDDHLQKDVPAVLEYVLQATGAKQLHWIGHSMVGVVDVVCLQAV
jgi:pimeloyl-ACP methyl ester carboxylesterase